MQISIMVSITLKRIFFMPESLKVIHVHVKTIGYMLGIKLKVDSFLGGKIQELREDVKNQAFTHTKMHWFFVM